MTAPQTTTLLKELQGTFGDGTSWTPKGGDNSGTYWETPAFILLWWPAEGQRDPTLSGVWDQRRGNQASPVVLLAPTTEHDKVRVVGPQERQPVRVLPSDRVRELLRESRDRSAREAASFLAREFSRLEASVVPGITAKDLLTPHFLMDDERLMSPTNRQKLESVIADVDISKDGSWQSLFRAFGYADERLPQRGYLLKHGDNAPIAVVHPYVETQQFSRLTDKGELPEGLLLADCENERAHWGILTAQGRFRVFQRQPPIGSSTGQYFEIDVGELRSQDRLYMGLLAPQSLREGGWLTEWVGDAKDFGEKLRQGLEERLIKDALPNIARGLGEYRELQGADLSNRDELRQIEEAALTLVFRFMFLLHTEARGYLPVNSPAYRPKSATALADDSRKNLTSIDNRSSTRWNQLRVLVGMVRTGDSTAGVPAYNGSLFAAEGFPGSALLESAEVKDSYLAPALAAIAFDTTKNDSPGLDYAGLDVGHLGAIYEKLLSYRLTRAPEDLAYDSRRDFFRPPLAGEQPEITRAQLYYQAEAGGRKAGGVYYTRREFVDHLLNHSLVPALDDHLKTIEALAKQDPTEAARRLFDFSVVDPAMGSAHFLTVALDKMADRFARFLADIEGLPTIGDEFNELTQEAGAASHTLPAADQLRRLILKRCIYGVDISPMAVEVANVTLWLASFVPGLALTYLGSNLKCGDALIGVADPSVVGASDSPLLTGRPVEEAMKEAARLQQELAENPDRTPDEVKQSEQLSDQLREATAGLRTAFNLWAAEPLGLDGARHSLETNAEAIIVRDEAKTSAVADEIGEANRIAEQYRFFHWPLEFPSVFYRDRRDRPGFDVVVGNPPWNEVTIEELAFYALREPGLRGLPNLAERRERIAALDAQNPALRGEFELQQEQLATVRKFFTGVGGYQLQGVGDTDLYQLFCERYSHLVRQGGRLGVVLPRTAFLAEGAKGFRQWLFEATSVSGIDFLLNTARWAFDMEPRYSIALLSGQHVASDNDTVVRITGPSVNLVDFQEATRHQGISISTSSLGSVRVIPLTPTQLHSDVLAKLRLGT